MANTTSGTTTFDKTFSIDEIIEESFERLGIQDVTGYHLKSSRRLRSLVGCSTRLLKLQSLRGPRCERYPVFGVK